MNIILVTGSNGQLGNELQKICIPNRETEFLFTTRAELNLQDRESINDFFIKHKITHCVNAAAYTAVDLAEKERDESMLINAEAVGLLAKACRQQRAVFIHVSTDYVFNGKGQTPYKETDQVSPVNYYGSTKLAGEKAAVENNPSSIIIRTSWLYSSFGKNFVKTMIRLMKEKDSINVVDDQMGSPTYAADLATAILKILSNTSAENHAGIYHYSNSGIISWFEFATAIRDVAGLECEVNPIPTSSFPTPASRPSYSAMDCRKISENFGIVILPWKESLARCIAQLL